MSNGEIVAGLRQRWRLLDQVGEGDAGEVFWVESLLEQKSAVLKRPRSRAFATDILRQATQIRNEGRLLAALSSPGVDTARRVRVPALLDESPAAVEYGEKTFIIIEKAEGIDLATLARCARYGPAHHLPSHLAADPLLLMWVHRLAERGRLPAAFLAGVLSSALNYLDDIHKRELQSESIAYSGIIWNDVKPDHLYWAPLRPDAGSSDLDQPLLTLIDWGNGQLLQSDGATKDRQFSWLDDVYQFLVEIGKFLREEHPEFHERMQWPVEIQRGVEIQEIALDLGSRLESFNAVAQQELRDLRRKELELASISEPTMSDYHELETIQRQILDYGVFPDHMRFSAFFNRLARTLCDQENWSDLEQVVGIARRFQPQSAEKWDLVARLLGGLLEKPVEARDVFRKSLSASLSSDWPGAYWELTSALPACCSQEWLLEIARQMRQLHFGVDPDLNTPFVAVNRLYYTLQSAAQRAEVLRPLPLTGEPQEDRMIPPTNPSGLDTLLQIFSTEVVKKWQELEPHPPNAGVDYAGVDSLLDEIEEALPGTRQSLDIALMQARAQVNLVLDAWRQQDFDAARRGLRQAFLWDPERRRMLTAERAIRSAPEWLVRLRQGAAAGEPFDDFLTNLELAGRELRTQVAPSPWLDRILETLKNLRKGSRPADLIIAQPEILNDLPWLSEYRSREAINLPRSRPFSFERPVQTPPPGIVKGVTEGVLGPNQAVTLAEPLDSWIPEARGSSARVFGAVVHGEGGLFALKLMRPDRRDYALPLFREEAQILAIMRDVSGVIPLLELGYLKLHDGQDLPGEDRSIPAGHLRGSLQRYSPEETQNFLAVLEQRAASGWLPYLLLERIPPDHNLMAYCDAGRTHGWFLPLKESLFLGIQICDILQIAHDRNIVYRDHKLLHYYWDPAQQGIRMIDWNIARRHSEGVSAAEKQFDLVQFAARALHHILTGRPAPGALPLGPNRPEDIEQSAHQYAVQWTYDDERLPNVVKDLLERSLVDGYVSARDLRSDLYSIYQQLPDSDAI